MLSSKNLMKNKKKKGFSLLEIVVSLGLIALFIIPMGNMVLGTVKINKAAEDKQQASTVLQETVEYIKGLEEMPIIGELLALENGVSLTRTADQINPDEVFSEGETPKERMYFIVEKEHETDYGFTVEGEIYGKEVPTEIDDLIIIEEVEDISGKIDGVLYYNYKKTWVIDTPLNLTDAINIQKPNRKEEFIADDKLKIEDKGNGIFKFGPKGEYKIKRDKGAILIILDGYTVPFNFNIDITGGKNVVIYLYDKSGRITKNDIKNNNINATIKIIKSGEGSGNGGNGNIAGSINISGSTTSLYSFKANAIKEGKSVDSLSADFVK